MTTTTIATERLRGFIAEVARHFDDLPEADRAELLDDLEGHMLELAAEDDASLEHELTDPAVYAAELRHSAGLPERTEGEARGGRLHDLAERVRTRIERMGERPAAREFLDFLPLLRPAWWVVRAWAMLVITAWVLSGGGWSRHAIVPWHNLLGLAALFAAIVFSVRAGRAGRDRTRPWRVLDAGAAFAVVVLAVNALTASPSVEHVFVSDGTVSDETFQPSVLRHPDGEPITNLYLYDRDGMPLEDVLVYDGIGRPVEIGQLGDAGFDGIDTIYPRDEVGTPITNQYPLEQFSIDSDEFGNPTRTRREVPGVVLPLGVPQTAVTSESDTATEPEPSAGVSVEPTSTDATSPSDPNDPAGGEPSASAAEASVPATDPGAAAPPG